MGTADTKDRTKKPTKSGLQKALEGILERMREDLEGLFAPRHPVPVPIPVPTHPRRR